MNSMPKPRILFVGAFPPSDKHIFGGNVTACRTLMNSSFPKRLELDLLDSTQISNPAPSFPIRLLLAVKRLVLFVCIYEARSPDAILLFTGSGAGLVEKGLMGWYARIRKGKTFIFPRGGGLLKKFESRGEVPVWVRACFVPAEKIFCQGKVWQDFVMQGLGRGRTEAPVIPNWSATPDFLKIGASRHYNSSSRSVRLLFVGWVEREKGILDLLEAFKRIVENHEVTLDVVGKGTAQQTAERFADDHGLGVVVRFSGWQAGKALEEKFRDSDILVLPSWVEGLPNTMIEAMAAGLCVVVTRVGNIPDVIRDGENGLIVHPKDVDGLAAAIESVVSNAELRARLAKAGYEIASEKFSVESAADRLIDEMFLGVNPVRKIG